MLVTLSQFNTSRDLQLKLLNTGSDILVFSAEATPLGIDYSSHVHSGYHTNENWPENALMAVLKNVCVYYKSLFISLLTKLPICYQPFTADLLTIIGTVSILFQDRHYASITTHTIVSMTHWIAKYFTRPHNQLTVYMIYLLAPTITHSTTINCCSHLGLTGHTPALSTQHDLHSSEVEVMEVVTACAFISEQPS